MTFIKNEAPHKEFPALWKLALFIAAFVFGFIAYSCFLPVEKLSARQRRAAFKTVLVHDAFGEHAAQFAPVATALSFGFLLAFLISGQKPRKTITYENRYDRTS